jgi:hypothetical protein
MAQAFKLGKHEPHPMGPFAAFGKFISDLVMDVRLSVQEAHKVSIGHYHAPLYLPADQRLVIGDAQASSTCSRRATRVFGSSATER